MYEGGRSQLHRDVACAYFFIDILILSFKDGKVFWIARGIIFVDWDWKRIKPSMSEDYAYLLNRLKAEI